MEFPDDVRYTAEHEWVRFEDGGARMGITDFAQDALGDIVYVDLPEAGRAVTANEAFCEVESTKSVSDIYAPVAGTVTEVNEALRDNPQKINDDPFGEGWICVLETGDGPDAAGLMDAAAYRQLVEEE